MQKYSHKYSITAADMDKDYRLTPSAVLLYYQDCWARFMSVCHIAAFDVVKQQKMWVITEFESAFADMDVFWSDEVEVTVWDSELTPLRLYSDFYITNVRTKNVVARGYACWNLLDTVSKRIIRVDELEGQPLLLPEMMLETHRRSRFTEEGELVHCVHHQVNQLDLDFNGHVNNRSYLAIAMLTAPDEFLHSYVPCRMQMQWLHETFFGDTIRCELHKLDAASSEYLHLLFNQADVCVAKIHSQWTINRSTMQVSEAVSRI